MRPLGHRRQVVLFLVAILVPCALLVVVGFRMLSQDRELREKRRADEQRRTLEQIRKDLLGRLERVKSDEFEALEQQRETGNRLVSLVCWVSDNRPVLPWERGGAAKRLHDLLSKPYFEPKIREGEQAEFALGGLEKAIASYKEALRLARHPAQAAYARLLLARALDKLGRRGEALVQFRVLLRVPVEISDEDGVPLKLYAAERLGESGSDKGAVKETMRWVTEETRSLSPAGWYIVSRIADKLADPGIRARVNARIRQTEQVVALQNDFPRLHNWSSNSSPVWVPYGEETWLVSSGPSRSGRAALIAVRASEVVKTLEADWAGRVRLIGMDEAGGELLGRNFPGLKAAFSIGMDPALTGHGDLQRYFYLMALALVMGATMFGAYLLWRDVRRELRLAEVRSQFVSSVSHELKTPLTAIRMFAETLQMGRQQDPELQSEYLDTIVNECERLTRLVDDVLLFSRIERGKEHFRFRAITLAEVVRAAGRALQYPLSQQGFDLHVRIEDGLPPFRGDHDALEQAILNLLSNAMKYSGDARDIELELLRANGEAVIRVSDHGMGIASEEQTRIFEKFYRAPIAENQRIPGTGLGLTLVAHIAKAHGGRVEVRSVPGQGSTFSIYLPVEVVA